jgi:hypothetical protein
LEYDGFINVHVPPSESDKTCLAIWATTEWRIIDYANTDSFPVAEKMLYMFVRYNMERKAMSSGIPFIAENKDSIRILEPDAANTQPITLTSMAHLDSVWFNRMQSATFEGANQPDFSDAKILYTIKDVPGDRFQAAIIKQTQSFRYIRYVSPKDREANCNVAEIKIFGADSSVLQGKPIGTPETHPAWPTMTFDKAFDGDISTCFDAKSNDSWTGLDLGKPCKIGKIHYAPRNEGAMGIYEGNSYELFYWDGENWKSLGEKKATIEPLQYQVPANALFFIKNNTTKKTGMLFIIQNGVQKWII